MRVVFLIIWFFVLPVGGQGQTDSLQGDPMLRNNPLPLSFERQFDKLRDDPALDYQEHQETENAWTRFKQYLDLQWNRLLDRIFGNEEASGVLLWLLESIPYLILFSVLALLIFVFTRLDPGSVFLSRSRLEKNQFSQEEKIIRYQDIPSLIQDAVERQEYRLAIRYHFLYILQQLSLKNIILYDKTKTDADYAEEIKEGGLRTGFKEVSEIYDFIWYGYFETGEGSYTEFAQQFRELERMIEGNHE